MTDHLSNAYPALATQLQKTALADLPTPIGDTVVDTPAGRRAIRIKYDNQTSYYYGGNKLRKLEYLLRRAIDKQADRVATFGTVGSHHALATTLFARRLDFGCTCLLSHQSKTPSCATTLGLLLQHDAEIVRYGGDYHTRIQTMRRHVQGRNTWVIPPGGSSWLGAVGYVNAGLEFAAQTDAGKTGQRASIYIAAGTMGSAAGLALGLALAGDGSEVQAVRVSPSRIMNRSGLDRLMNKTAMMLNRLDPAVPADLAQRTRITIRDEFFGEGYAKSNAETDAAIEFAREQLALSLEPTYTGKAMAALLHDTRQRRHDQASLVFWHTYNSNPLPAVDADSLLADRLPKDFLRYLEPSPGSPESSG